MSKLFIYVISHANKSPLTNCKVMVGPLVINFICYFIKTIVQMFIFSPFHKAASKLFNGQQICSSHSVVLQFHIVLSALY